MDLLSFNIPYLHGFVNSFLRAKDNVPSGRIKRFAPCIGTAIS